MKRVKYISQFSRDMSREEIDSLVARSAQKNAARGISGILMVSGRLFYQVVEGPVDQVDGILAQIFEDERHKDVLILETEDNIAQRIFPDWSMRQIEISREAEERLAPLRHILVDIIEKHREIEMKTHQLERSIWYELASEFK